jgi:hypothetical protein
MKSQVEKRLVVDIVKERLISLIDDLTFLATEGSYKDKYFQALFAAQALESIVDDIRMNF